MYSGRKKKHERKKEAKYFHYYGLRDHNVESRGQQQSLCWPKKLKGLQIKF